MSRPVVSKMGNKMEVYLSAVGWLAGERRVFERRRDTDEKGKDESWENGKEGPNTESVGDGGDPRIRIIVPEMVDVRDPEIGREGKDGGHDHLIHSLV
jgi:hypothetical protein